MKWIQTRHTIFVLIFLATATLTLSCLGVFSTPFFRDYVIVFEGGYRVLHGQMPYRDFFIPTGPIIFYMQAFFECLFGVNLWASAMHAGGVAAILICNFYLVTVKKLGSFVSSVMSLLLYFSFTGYITYPWYNTTAYFFFLLNVLFLIPLLDKEKLEAKVYLISAVLCVMTFFSKQDVGVLHFAGLFAFFSIHYTADLKKISFCFLGAAFLLAAGIALFFQFNGDFLYWFDHWQKKDSQVMEKLANGHFFLQWRLYCVLALGVSQLLFKISKGVRKRLFMLAFLLGVPLVTKVTSGCSWQATLQGIPLVLYVVYEIVESFGGLSIQLKSQRLGIKLSLILLACISSNPFYLVGRYFTGSFLTRGSYEGNAWAEGMKRKFDLEGFAPIPNGSYKNCLIKKDLLPGLFKVEKAMSLFPESFFNMSEYAFLNVDFKHIPIMKLPLWFDEGVSYSHADVPRIMAYVQDTKPRLIFLQDAHTNKDRGLQMFYAYSWIKKGKYASLFKTAAPAGWDIHVLVLPPEKP